MTLTLRTAIAKQTRRKRYLTNRGETYEGMHFFLYETRDDTKWTARHVFTTSRMARRR